MNVARFIGKPFEAGAHGPDAFDCWGLVHTAARELFGLHFPEAIYASVKPDAVATAADVMLIAGGWQEHKTAAAGRVMALCDCSLRVRHVGLCLDNTRVLHATHGAASCVMPVAKLAQLYPVRFYAWAH